MQIKKSLHSKLKANYASMWTEDTDRLCADELTGLLGEIGPERLAKAVQGMIAHESFFQIANLRKYIPSAQRERITCPKCYQTSGFVYCEILPGERQPRVRRCTHEAA